MAQMPRILKNFNLFVDGVGYAGLVETLSVPVLTIKSEEFRAGGMDIPMEIDMGQEKLEANFALAEYSPATSGLFGTQQVAEGTQLTARGAMQRDGEAAIPILINMTGRIYTLDPGEWKAGDRSMLTHRVALAFYRETIDGTVVHEIDVVNMKRIINGVDQMATIRTAIGV